MPQDDTWEPNRHHSHILPLFRSHLTRDTAAMFPLFQNPVASTEHESRNLRLPAVSHTENAEEEGRCVVLGLPKLYNVYSNHHDDSSGGTESRRQLRNHGSQQVRTAGVGVRRGGATFHPEYGGTICPEQSDRNSIPTGTGVGKDVPDHETVGGGIGASRSRQARKNVCWVASKRQRPCGEKWYETIEEEEKLQSNKDVAVQCIIFCEVTTSDVYAVLRHAPADLRGGTLLQHLRVLVATVA